MGATVCGSVCFRNQDSTMLKLAIAVVGLATLASAQSPLNTGLTPTLPILSARTSSGL